MKGKIVTTIFALLALSVGATAQEDNLRVHFDFSNVSGKYVTDEASGISARLMGAASVKEVGDFHVLDLGNASGYLDLTKSTGVVVYSLSDFTLSLCYRLDEDASLSGAGYFLWTFSSLVSCTQTGGIYSGYRLNAQRMATSPGGFGSEVGMELGRESVKGRWVHFLYRQTGNRGEVFLDGERVMQQTGMPVYSETFRAAPANCWIGRPPFGGDNYLRNTLVADFRLYDVALTSEDIASLSGMARQLEKEYRYGTPGDFSQLSSVIAECEQFMAEASTGYAPNAVAELQDEINIARIELDNARASQALIDTRLAALRSRLAAAKATKGFKGKTARRFKSGEQGFVHPGGLVSQADIDRARQMLADGDARIKRAWEILCANGYSDANVATWPTPTVIRGGGSGQNYMNCARGAAMAYQNALRWKIGGTRENADAAVRIMMQWARECNGLGGDTNVSLTAGIYGHEFANAAELMRDYEGWSDADFEFFKQWMIRVFYNPAIDFLRRRHDTWLNFRYPALGERPGHYWSNWGLCNALCVMSMGILCDDVHMYNQGVSFYKYDHVGTFNPDRTKLNQILNDGCNEYIGNLVPVMMPDERGPFGYLGQMQESGRDQGHSLMALGLAIDICQVGLNQGDDLFAYMDDRLAAGAEFVAAMNFGGVDAATLPWKNYNYADCRGTMGASWLMPGPNTGGAGEFRPYWDRLLGYYEGVRGVKMQYTEKASAAVCPDGGGGNYSQNSGGFDHLGFSTLTHWRPAITLAEAITPLSGDIVYKGETLKNQTNLGGLKYKYEACPTKAIPADGAEITLIPQLPEGATDSGQWQWSTGETTRQITVHADRSYIYRVTYTAPNGTQSHQSFAIAVAGDADPDQMNEEITVDATILADTVKTVLYGTAVTLYAGATTGWTNDYLWDNGVRANVTTIPNLTTSRTYTCQYANQSGAVSEARFHLSVVPAMQRISVNGAAVEGNEAQVFSGTPVTLRLLIPDMMRPESVEWQDGSHGTTFTIPSVEREGTYTATYLGTTYTYNIYMKDAGFTYYDLLSSEHGYTVVQSEAELESLVDKCYFVLASDEADLLVGLADAKMNGNKALHYQTPVDPETDFLKLWRLEPFDGGYCLRNMDYDGLLIQTEWDAPWNIRTHDQPYGISWARFLLAHDGSSWTIENGTYPGNWAGLWFPENGYADGEEMACNKQGDEVGHFQLFAIPKGRLHADLLAGATEDTPVDATPLLLNPSFAVATGAGWTLLGTWGNQRYNGAAEIWHSTNFDIFQTLPDMPAGHYTVTAPAFHGEGAKTACLYATAGGVTSTDVVTQSSTGSNFDAERDRMAANANYGLLSVETTVPADGNLRIGLREPTNGTTWVVFDNFRLTYHGPAPNGIEALEGTSQSSASAGAVYDLTGRRVAASAGAFFRPSAPRGIYIVGGRKYVK